MYQGNIHGEFRISRVKFKTGTQIWILSSNLKTTGQVWFRLTVIITIIIIHPLVKKFSQLFTWGSQACLWGVSQLRQTSCPVLAEVNVYIWNGRLWSFYRNTWVQQIDLFPTDWLHNSVGRALYWPHKGQGFKSCWSYLNFSGSYKRDF